MTRPKKERIVSRPPVFSRFKPAGIMGKNLKQLNLSLDEYEAIRLADLEGLDHVDAAEKMEISRSTFTRLVEKARRKMAEFLVEGRMLVIDGGVVHFRGNLLRCSSCGKIFETGFRNPVTRCPACDSEDLVDIAEGYGHGRCCRGLHRER